MQAVRSCCAECTTVMPATGKLEPPRKGPRQRFCKLRGSAAQGLHLSGLPNGKLEPPRKDSAGTVGGHGSDCASCAEPQRRVYTFQACQTASLNPQEKTLPAQLVATAALVQVVRSRCGGLAPHQRWSQAPPCLGHSSRDPWENPQEHPIISCKIPVIQLACILGLSEIGEHPPIHGNFMGKSR